MDIFQAKARARLLARDARRRLAAGNSDAARRLADCAEAAVAARPGPVAGYWPLADEIDPRPLLVRLARAGRPVAPPRVEGRAEPLAFRRWQPGDPLTPGPFRVMQPAAQAEAVTPAILLVPLLAFDREGYRLGYGGGFYDRTLADLRRRAPVFAIGLAFAGQEVGRVLREAHDQPLDIIATDAGLIEPRRGDEKEVS